MKVKQLRLLSNCYALKSGHNFMANAHTKIERLTNGDYMVRLGDQDPVIVGSTRVDFAVCVEDSRVPVSELKK